MRPFYVHIYTVTLAPKTVPLKLWHHMWGNECLKQVKDMLDQEAGVKG